MLGLAVYYLLISSWVCLVCACSTYWVKFSLDSFYYFHKFLLVDFLHGMPSYDLLLSFYVVILDFNPFIAIWSLVNPFDTFFIVYPNIMPTKYPLFWLYIFHSTHFSLMQSWALATRSDLLDVVVDILVTESVLIDYWNWLISICK